MDEPNKISKILPIEQKIRRSKMFEDNLKFVAPAV
jgi:hypothetical protein